MFDGAQNVSGESDRLIKEILFAAVSDGGNSMISRRPALLEVQYPQCSTNSPKRDEASRTVVQPDTDAFKQADANLAEECTTKNSSGKTNSSRAWVARGAT